MATTRMTMTTATAGNGPGEDREAPPPPPAIARIERLPTDVVNRIAAGEVIHRPANALKELLENSLDAGATQITVTVNHGGLKLLQIQDNGRGIHREDLAIVCERFTTSKLRTFEDLREISSFGFRGEALASISHVAHVTITSKTAEQPCAYKAHYRDGKPIAKKPGATSDPTPCAGKNGTQIVVEDLFYNLPTRRQAFKNTSEQYQRIMDVVQRYAIHYGSRNVGFVCKKYRDPSCDVNTLSCSTQLDVIRHVFGSKVANELIEFSFTRQPVPPHRDLEFEARAWVSNANFSVKSSSFILFINDRLVDCAGLKRACEYVYSLYLPKHTHPFVYMSLKMPPHNLDVNVHPTKREVHFLYEELIVEALTKELEKQLKGSNDSRVFVVQPITAMMAKAEAKEKTKDNDTQANVLTPGTEGAKAVESESDDDQESESGDDSSDDPETPLRTRSQSTKRTSDSRSNSGEHESESQSVELDLSQRTTPNSKKYHPAKAPQKLVRTDHLSNTIDKYFFLESQRSSQLSLSQSLSSSQIDLEDDDESPEPDTANKSGNLDKIDGSSSPGVNEVHASRRSKKRKLSDALDSAAAAAAEPESEEDVQLPSTSRRESILHATQSPQMLTSVLNLCEQIQTRRSKALEKMFREHSFVGVVNRQHSLIQYRTKLYLVRHRDLAYHLFYEKALQQFGQFAVFQLPAPFPVFDLVFEALGNPRIGYDEEDGPKDQLAREIEQLLVANGPMLAEYFALDIDASGQLRTLPRLLVDHEPSLHSLPEFLFHLATEVNWEEEQPCFDNVAQVLAQWYSELWYPTRPERQGLILEHVLFPAMKPSGGPSATMPFTPPNELNDSAIIRPIACLTKLYRIFERC